MNVIYKVYTGILVMFFLSASICGYAQKQHYPMLRPGDYDPLIIAYDSASHVVTGYLEEKTEMKPYISCNLYFTGIMDSSMQKAEILFYEFFLDAKVKSEGTLSVEKEGDIRIKSKNSIMPCQYIENISDYSASLSQPKRYNRIAIIKSQRQYLYRSPNEGAATKAYLIKCDPVIIVKQQGQWLLIKYLKNEKTERWIPSSAVFL